jgi:uncharacterized protein (DUF697 family)
MNAPERESILCLSLLPAAVTVAAGAKADQMVLNYAILNGALELLPESLATMAITPLQMKKVHRIGKAHGDELDRWRIKDLLAAAGVGLTSQVVEGDARRLPGGLLGKPGGGMMKSAGQQVASSAMSFATTWALGTRAARYYCGRPETFGHRTAPTLRPAHRTGSRPARQPCRPHPQQSRLAEPHPTADPDPRAAVSGGGQPEAGAKASKRPSASASAPALGGNADQ